MTFILEATNVFLCFLQDDIWEHCGHVKGYSPQASWCVGHDAGSNMCKVQFSSCKHEDSSRNNDKVGQIF